MSNRIIHPNMPAHQYHAHPNVSKSLLDKLARSPMHARAYLDGVREEPTPAMQFGTALHTAVLEPERFANEYAVFEGDRRTKAGKEAYELLLNAGATVINRADYDAIRAMALQIRQHPRAGMFLQNGAAEQSVFWTDKISGVDCKCRPDWTSAGGGVILDLKTTEDASPEAFARSVAKYRYHVQASHYLEGTEADWFLFVAVEKKAPYAVAVYELDPEAMEIGRCTRLRDLEVYLSCRDFNQWPGYPTDVQTLALPAWMTGSRAVTEEDLEVSYV